jgi:predicted DNA-binding protein
MDTHKSGSTSEMQVTSIRLEAELKERLRELSGDQGYQTLIREILWRFVEQHSMPLEERSLSQTPLLSRSDVRATFEAIAQQEEYCVITGQLIQPQQPIRLGLTITGKLVPLST